MKVYCVIGFRNIKVKCGFYFSAPPPSMSDLANDFETIVNDSQFSDVEFLIENKTVHAHKAIICARSDYFRAMFGNKMKETFATV